MKKRKERGKRALSTTKWERTDPVAWEQGHIASCPPNLKHNSVSVSLYFLQRKYNDGWEGMSGSPGTGSIFQILYPDRLCFSSSTLSSMIS